ncbi:MAG TPA: hypothetical protein VKH36_08585 [Acidimicrobiia bacterium]|nr:hypothetical protein [Acidimicrobiia bacterium]
MSDDDRREHRDELPEELDVTAYVGPYVFPNINRRRIPAAMYAVLALLCFAGWVYSTNLGLLVGAVLLGAISAYHFATAWNLEVDQTQALVVATRTVGFPVGHASAQLAWRGLRSRPVWRILLYSADDPPTMRGLVELDAVDGHVMGEYTEPNPEDWSKFGLGADGKDAGG